MYGITFLHLMMGSFWLVAAEGVGINRPPARELEGTAQKSERLFWQDDNLVHMREDPRPVGSCNFVGEPFFRSVVRVANNYVSRVKTNPLHLEALPHSGKTLYIS